MHELRNLAVPFGLLLAKNGMEYLKTRSGKTSTRSSKSARATKTPTSLSKTRKSKSLKGGDCGCTSKATKLGGSSCGMPPPVTSGGSQGVSQELNALSNRLNSLVLSYGGRS